MEPLLEWPINLMKPLLTRQQKDWQTYSKVWIDVQMSTEKLYQFVIFSLLIVCCICTWNCILYLEVYMYMYVNFVFFENVFY